MRYILIIGAMVLGFAPTSHADAYRCEDEDGHVMFSDEPCGENAEAIELETSSPDQSERDNLPRDDDADSGDQSSSRASRQPVGEDETPMDQGSDGEAQASSNPCLDNRPDNEVMQPGTSESRIRAACGAPDEVTTGNEVFDKTLHYSGDDRQMEIFIRDGTKVGHNAL